MVELNGDMDPTIALTTASDAIKYTRTLQQTNLVYGPGEPPLIPGKRYAFRVRAYNTEGYDLYKNDGYSDVRVFQFGDACNPPIAFTLSDETQSTFTIEVQPAPGNTAWEAQLREEDDESGEWTILKPESGNTKTVKGLKPSTSYQVQLNAVCGPFTSDITQPQTITTKPRVNSNRECDNNVSPFVVQQAGPLSKLKPDDIFVAALMPIRVTQVTKQGGGKFSGKGIATLPFVSAGLAVTFDDIGINELGQLTSGEVKVVRDVTNATWFGDTPPPVPNTGGGSTGTATDSTGTWPPFTDTINIDVPFDTIIVVNDSTIMVVPQTGGEAITVNLGGSTCTLIVPPDGNLDNAQVVYNGAAKPYRTGQGNGNSTQQEQFNGFLAKFSPAPGMLYGFDTLRFEQLTSEYAEIKVNGKNVKMPWKALKAGATDVVELHIRRNPDTLSFDKLKVGVYNGGNLAPSAGANTSKQTYTLTGTTDGEVQAIVASFADAKGDTQYAGGLNTITYAQQDMNLIMVPLPGVNLSDAMVAQIQVGLNEIYHQAVVEWTVTPLNGFPGIDLGDNGLDWADKEMLSAYNQEMNALIAAFKNWAEENGKPLDPDAFYLFVVPRFSESGLEGFMPLNHRFGFVAQGQIALDDRNNLSAMHVARTVAHELGHGVFNLRHTFSEKNFVILPKGATGNLMDYPTTPALADRYTGLIKTQWDLIHNPQTTTGLFDDMEEGAIQVTETTYEAKWEKFTGDITTFISPAGLPITIPKPDSVLITHGPTRYQVSRDKVLDIPFAEHVLIAFKYESGVTYIPYIAAENGENVFYGYITDVDKMDFFEDSKTTSLPASFSVKLLDGASPVIKLCQIKPEQVFADAEYAKYNPGGKYRAAGPLAYRVDDISLKAKGFYYSAYKKAELLKESPVLKTAIEDDPGVLKDAFTYRQYFIVKDWEIEEKLFKLIFLGGLGVTVAPVAIQAVIPIAEGYVVKKAGDFAIGAVIDGTLQVVLLAADGQKFPDVVKNVDVFQMLRSGAENLVSDPALSAMVSCFSDGLMEGGHFKQQITAESFSSDCIWGAFSSLLSYEASEALNKNLPKLKQLFFKTPEKARFALTNLGIPEGKADEIVERVAKTNAVRETFELSEEAFGHLVLISDQLKTADGTLCDECVDALARLLAGHSGDIVEEVVKKARSVGLTLEEQAAFFTDLAKVDGHVSDASRLLANNLNKIDESIIEAWRLLDGSPVIRIDITNLENLKKVLQSQDYTKLGTLDGLKQAINSSSNKSKFIELLSNAKVRPGTNGKYAVIGTNMAERVEVFARDIKPMVGDNIELFNKASQKNNKFVIDGVEKTLDKIMNDFKKLLKKYEVDYFPYEPKYKSIVEGSSLYKANKQFIEKLLMEGYTIIDIGKTYDSFFYEMEKSLIYK
ncbi:MAG: hypothetical protein PWR03_1781 [Tenuifilum sp.]|nr:hypothetical protein [Tenuifilum sp.]